MKPSSFLTIAGLTLSAAGLVGTSVSAATLPASSEARNRTFHTRAMKAMHKPLVGGTITAVNGTLITLTTPTGTVYTVDTSAATVVPKKDNATTSLFTIGSNIGVNGTISGTTITAATIFSAPEHGLQKIKIKMAPGHTPHAFGTVSNLNGSNFTIALPTPLGTTTPTTRTLTVVTSATTSFTKDGAPASLADVVNGTKVIVQGTINKDSATLTAATINVVTKDLKIKTGHGLKKGLFVKTIKKTVNEN